MYLFQDKIKNTFYYKYKKYNKIKYMIIYINYNIKLNKYLKNISMGEIMY